MIDRNKLGNADFGARRNRRLVALPERNRRHIQPVVGPDALIQSLTAGSG